MDLNNILHAIFTGDKTGNVSTTTKNWSIFFTEDRNSVYSENYMKLINDLCEKNAAFLVIKHVTYKNHIVANGWYNAQILEP